MVLSYTNSPSTETEVSVEMPSTWYKTVSVQYAFPVKPMAAVLSPGRFRPCEEGEIPEMGSILNTQ